MEHLKTAMGQAAQSAQMQTSSANLQKASSEDFRGPTEEEFTEMFKLITRIRSTNGWNLLTDTEAEPQILIWCETFAEYGIPPEAYKPLFNRAFDVRQQAIRETGLATAEKIEAALLVSCWTGPHGLKAKWEADRIKAGRTLPDSLLSACPRCFGTGTELIYDDRGRTLGARPGCRHEPLVEGEWLWKQENLRRQRAEDEVQATSNVVDIGR